MISLILVLCLCTIFLYNFLPVGLVFVKRFKAKSKDIDDDGNPTEIGIGHKKLKPLPEIPIFRLLLRLVLFEECRSINFLKSIGKFNQIAGFSAGNRRLAIINDYKLGKELYKNPVFCGKPTTEILTFYAQGSYGIINTFGHAWKGQRKFVHSHLKEFGFGTRSMEAFIQIEIDDLLESWRLKNGERFAPNKDFYIPVLNSLWVLLAGERASLAEDPQLLQLLTRVYQGFSDQSKFLNALLASCEMKLKTLDKVTKWIPIFAGIQEFKQSLFELRSYFQTKIIDVRKKALNLDKTATAKDLVDEYLIKMHNTTNPDAEFFEKKGEMHLLATMIDFFIAGGDTTANMLAWAMLHLIRNPDIQNKIRMELDSVVGVERRPNLSDRINCPYTEAFMWELLRFDPVASFSAPHETTENTNIGPYFVQKGTILTLNIYHIHHDPDVWGDPQNFRPERFLSPGTETETGSYGSAGSAKEDSDRPTVLKHEAMCAFGYGLRRCVGEQVARDNLFLFLSAICQRFVLSQDPLLKGPPPVRDTKSGLHVPDIFYVVATDRFGIAN